MIDFLKRNRLLSASLIFFFLLSIPAFFATKKTYQFIEVGSLWIRSYAGYLYLYLGLGTVLLLLVIAFSAWGKIRLGPRESRPEHSHWAWAAMLYSAGMGAGILLRAVQEPVYMRQNQPFVSGAGQEVLALEYTFYQWGFTAWAFYGLFAMVMGYLLFVDNKKVRISAAIEDDIANKTARRGINMLTIATTVFGLIAAVGLGTTQITGGLSHIFSEPLGIGTTISLACIVSAVAFVSVWKGVDRGIKVISKFNIVITLILLVAVFLLGDMGRSLKMFAIAFYHYLIDFVPMSIAYGKYNPGLSFLTDWTFYYWAFWLAWAPFTGIFIARISKGRTLRQLLLGVLILPSLGTFMWFAVFGTAAFGQIEAWGGYGGEFDNVFTSIFIFFEAYPMAYLFNAVVVLLLISFLVTSVDSAVLVLSMFTDRGNQDPEKKHRLLWSVLILLATLALVVLGHAKPEVDVLVAAQKLLIITSLPFAFFLLVMTFLFLRKISLRR